jgi:phosphoglucosamine mutase
MTEKKYFGTDGIRGRVGGGVMTAEFALKLGRAAGKVLGGLSRSNTIIIGKDTRISGYMLESALEAGLSSAGTGILLLGPMSTPAIAWLTRSMHASAGIVISASHNPFHDNGIKFFDQHGEKLSDELELAIEAELEQAFDTVPSERLGKARRIEDATGRYVEYCKSTFPETLNLHGMKLALDCANGATYRTAPQVFRELGAQLTVIGDHPDGLNINAGCGSTHPQKLQETVRNSGADVGIALDGDGDRVLMVDENGEVVDGDRLIFLVARHLHEKGQLNGGVVGTLMSNQGMAAGLQALGIPFQRANVGDRYVHQLLKKNGWILGGESSGHILNLNLASTGDGIISALMVLAVMRESGRSLRELAAQMPLFPQTLINVKADRPQDLIKHPQVQALSEQTNKKLADSGRVLIRASGTEPLVRVMVECRHSDESQQLARRLASQIEEIAACQ